MRLLTTILALGVSAHVAAQTPLTEIASANDADFGWDYVGIGIESRCGSDWFVLESGDWKCLRRNAAGSLDVIDFGAQPAVLDHMVLIRPPVAGDRRLLFADNVWTPVGCIVRSFDPVTLAVVDLGPLPASGYPGRPGVFVDVDGGTGFLMSGWSAGPDQIVSLPGGAGVPFQVLRSLPFRAEFAGQFDADPQSELAVLDANGVLRFYDASTLLLESFQPQGAWQDRAYSTPVVGDWDGDGVDEIAMQSLQNGTGLIDPNASPVPIYVTTPPLSFAYPLSLVDWQTPGSRDLALWGPTGVYLFNPRSGASLGQFAAPEYAGSIPSTRLRLDWDGDGDGDLAWIGSQQALWLLRNGAGLTILQRQATSKRVIGHTVIGGQPQLVSAESFRGQPEELRLRRRDPQTLALLGEATLSAPPEYAEVYAVADLHPQAGDEVLKASEYWLRLYALDGTLLWARENTNPLRRFRHAVVPDATCTGEHCRRVLILDDDFSGPDDTLRLFDTATGNELWSGTSSADWLERAIGLSDLDGDGVPELLYSDFAIATGVRLVALDGVTRQPRWTTTTGIDRPLQTQRTSDSAQRLTLLGEYGGIHYLDPATGAVRRSRYLIGPDSASCPQLCELRYLSQGATVGQWLVINFSDHVLRTMARDLRGPRWAGGAGYFPNSVAVLGPRLVNIASGTSIYALQAEIDGIFTDEFEGW